MATVYRTLQLFKDSGLVEEMRLGQVYYHYEIKGSAEHQHLGCRAYGKVIEFETLLIKKLGDTLKHEHGFNLTKIELYVDGYCPQCDKEASDIA